MAAVPLRLRFHPSSFHLILSNFVSLTFITQRAVYGDSVPPPVSCACQLYFIRMVLRLGSLATGSFPVRSGPVVLRWASDWHFGR